MKKINFLAIFAVLLTFCFLTACAGFGQGGGNNGGNTTYTVTFNSLLGTTVEPQTVAENGLATKPADPTREGYVFAYWTLNGVEYDFNTPVTANITLTAKWDQNFVVKFYDAKNNVIDTQYVAAGEDAVAPATNPTKEGYVFKGWDKAFTNVQGDLDIKPKFEEQMFTVIFMIDGVEYDRTDEAFYGDAVTPPLEPTKNGYKFVGWDNEEDEVYEDMVINGIYELVTYTATFYVGDTQVEPFTVSYNIEKGATLPELPGNGYTFSGWYEDSACTEFPVETLVGLYGDKTLYAKTDGTKEQIILDLIQSGIIAAEDYAVKFYLGSTEITEFARTYNIVDGCVLPTVTGTGYTFEGWYTNENFYGEPVETLVGYSGEKTLYAAVSVEVNVDASLSATVKDSKAVTTDTLTLTKGQYKTIKDALGATYSKTLTINLPAGTNSSALKINQNGVVLKGANAGVNPNTATRGEETIFTSVITLGQYVKNVVFDGIKFTGNSRITCETFSSEKNTVNNENIQLLNCYVDIKTTTSTANAFLDFPTLGRTYNKNIKVDSCYFTGETKVAMIYLDNNYDVTVNNTVIENVKLTKLANDGYAAFLYIDDSAAGCSGDVIFTNNKVTNITGTSAKYSNAIYIHWIGDYTGESLANYAQDIIVNDNEFTNIAGYVYRNSESNGQHLCYSRMEMNYNTFTNCGKLLCVYMGVNEEAQRFTLEQLEEQYGHPYNNTFLFNYNKVILGDNYTLTAEYAPGTECQQLATPVDNYAVIDASKNIYLKANGTTVHTNAASEFGAGVEVPTNFTSLAEFNAAVEASR